MWAGGYFCATVGAVDEATIKAYIESQKWDEDDRGFKIAAPTEPSAALSRNMLQTASAAPSTFSRVHSTGFKPVARLWPLTR